MNELEYRGRASAQLARCRSTAATKAQDIRGVVRTARRDWAPSGRPPAYPEAPPCCVDAARRCGHAGTMGPGDRRPSCRGFASPTGRSHPPGQPALSWMIESEGSGLAFAEVDGKKLHVALMPS